MKKCGRAAAAVAAVTTACLALGVAPAGADIVTPFERDLKTPFERLPEFLARVAGTRFASQGVVRDEQAFTEMRSYVLDLYRGVEAKAWFVDGDSIFDCVVTETQPSVRALGGAKLATPPAPTAMAGVPVNSREIKQLPDGAVDTYGNDMACPDGTIPMQRLTLERLAKFPTLKYFMAKEPAGAGSSAQEPPHAHAVGYQFVDNSGTNSFLNLWDPTGDYSLSQQWIINPNGGQTQTVESGWIHYLPKWNSPSVLFIFATADNYASGCHNLDCPGFVQVSNAFTLGLRWGSYSTYGGPQTGFMQQWKFVQGNWWLFIQNTALGYYPGSFYRGGPLGSGNATLNEFGGETVNTTGATWPPMGSGVIAGNYYGIAAFQNTLFNIDSAQGGHWSELSPIMTNPNCYTTFVQNHNSSGDPWPGTTWLFFGGPGGPTSSC